MQLVNSNEIEQKCIEKAARKKHLMLQAGFLSFDILYFREESLLVLLTLLLLQSSTSKTVIATLRAMANGDL